MSKDNREECPECKGTGLKAGITQEQINNCPIPDMLECDACNGTGEVTIDSGADVCEWEENPKFWLNPSCCNEDGSNRLSAIGWKYCPYCGKQITIKGE